MKYSSISIISGFVAAPFAFVAVLFAFVLQLEFNPGESAAVALDVPWITGEKMQIRWETDLNRAKMQAVATGKPLLLHFFSETCPPCKMMDRKTFPDETIIGLVSEHFIAVKVNTTRNPQAAQAFEVVAVPSDLIFAPDMRLISRTQGGKDPIQYAQYISQIANQYQATRDQYLQQRRQQIAANTPKQSNLPESSSVLSNPVPKTVPSTVPSTVPPMVPPTVPPTVPSANQYANAPMPPTVSGHETSGTNSASTYQYNNGTGNRVNNTVNNPAFYGTCPVSQTPSFDYSKLSDSARRRLEFDGNCPVELTDRQQWVRGNPQLALGYEGRIYFFAGMEQLEKFRKTPNLYAPAYSGMDIVALKESGQKVQGVRFYGAWTRGRVFLFSSETNLVKFERNPLRYIN